MPSPPRRDGALRVATWNLDWWQRDSAQTDRLELLDAYVDGVLLLQELRGHTVTALRDWPGPATFSIDLHPEATGRWMSNAVLLPAGAQVHDAGLVEDLPRSQRGMWVRATIKGVATPIVFVSWHCENAAGGPEKQRRKMQAYRAMSTWLASAARPTVLGADLNTWRDPVDLVRAAPGDPYRDEHAFVGPEPEHGLVDAYRQVLAHTGEFDDLRLSMPDGPLATSYELDDGTPHRFDRLFLSTDLVVHRAAYELAAARDAGSDHALHWADFSLTAPASEARSFTGPTTSPDQKG